MITKTCEACQKPFESYPSSNRRYCSKECQTAARRLPRTPCRHCGGPVMRSDTEFCSSVCYHESRIGQSRPDRVKPKVSRTCPQCSGTFEAGGRGGRKLAQVYCSEPCARRANWAPIDQAFNGSRSGHWQELRTKIIARDKACVFCGHAENLQAHHMIPREFGGTHDEDNLAAACRHCHGSVDRMIKIMKTKRPDFDIRVWLASFMEEL